MLVALCDSLNGTNRLHHSVSCRLCLRTDTWAAIVCCRRVARQRAIRRQRETTIFRRVSNGVACKRVRKREDAKRQIASGLDPSVKKKLDKIAEEKAAQNTFGAVAAEHLANMAADGIAETTLIKNSWMLEDLAAPLVHRPIAEIMPIEVLDAGARRPVSSAA